MLLIQLLLPLYDNKNVAFPKDLFNSVKDELTQRFGGVTVYARSPATGLWKETDENIIRDEIILFEIMVQEISIDYWKIYKEKLQNTFYQDVIIIRAVPIQLL